MWRYKPDLFHLIHGDEGFQELRSGRFILGHIGERLLCLVLGEEPQRESVDTEPVSYPEAVVIVGLLLTELPVNIIVHHALLHRARGHLGVRVKSSLLSYFLLSRPT